MKALLEFELQNWFGGCGRQLAQIVRREQALALFGRARGIYDRLHDIAGDVHKPLYLQVPA